MFIKPSPEGARTEVFRGPNIGEPPRAERMPEKLNGAVMIVVGDKITTDHIMPAGAAEVPLQRAEVRAVCVRERGRLLPEALP